MSNYPGLTDRFLKYVKVETRSDENSTTIPSTESQVEFAKQLAAELKELGLSNVRIHPTNGYVLATLPSNLEAGKSAKKVGFISHMDQR